jgi:hypothetical protein
MAVVITKYSHVTRFYALSALFLEVVGEVDLGEIVEPETE